MDSLFMYYCIHGEKSNLLIRLPYIFSKQQVITMANPRNEQCQQLGKVEMYTYTCDVLRWPNFNWLDCSCLTKYYYCVQYAMHVYITQLTVMAWRCENSIWLESTIPELNLFKIWNIIGAVTGCINPATKCSHCCYFISWSTIAKLNIAAIRMKGAQSK